MCVCVRACMFGRWQCVSVYVSVPVHIYVRVHMCVCAHAGA